MLLPLVRALPWASLAVCLVWANFFYEFHNELLFWVVLFAINSRTLQEKTFASLKS
jgi:hypothetical protein